MIKCARIAVILIFAVILLISCADSGSGNIDADTDNSVIDLSDYIIVRPDYANQDEIDAAVMLKNSITEKTDYNIKITTDFEKRGADPNDRPKHEILVGATNREESQEVLAELGRYDFAFKIINEKLVIIGGTGGKTREAVKYFIGNILADIDLSSSSSLSLSLSLKEDFSYINIPAEGEGGIMRTFTNPIAPTGNDPWLIFHGGYYYYCLSDKGGVCVARLENIYDINKAETVRIWAPPANTMYSKEIWAPELHYLDGDWYIYFAADDGKNENHRMYVLKGTSQNPLDEFIFMGKITDPSDKWAIDGTVMQYKNKLYFIWSGWAGQVDGSQELYIAEMSDPCTISGSRVRISRPDKSWERKGMPLNEGPVAIEHNGKTHIVYSASASWTDDYCLGLLTLVGSDPMYPASWEKSELPILTKSSKVFGPGHCSFTTSPDGKQTWVVYHANIESGTGWGGRKSWAQPIIWDDKNYPVIGSGIPPAPGEELEIIGNDKFP